MKLLLSERDAFAKYISIFSKLCGKSIIYLECLEEKLDFYSIKKKKKPNEVCYSLKHVLSILHALLHLITKKMHEEGVINIPFDR